MSIIETGLEDLSSAVISELRYALSLDLTDICPSAVAPCSSVNSESSSSQIDTCLTPLITCKQNSVISWVDNSGIQELCSSYGYDLTSCEGLIGSFSYNGETIITSEESDLLTCIELLSQCYADYES